MHNGEWVNGGYISRRSHWRDARILSLVVTLSQSSSSSSLTLDRSISKQSHDVEPYPQTKKAPGKREVLAHS